MVSGAMGVWGFVGISLFLSLSLTCLFWAKGAVYCLAQDAPSRSPLRPRRGAGANCDVMIPFVVIKSCDLVELREGRSLSWRWFGWS